ncbi:MAG: molybdopterin-dependent oxidoreductase, partial [Eggerthella lenta]
MSEHAITRRSFLAGSAGAVALTAAAGYVSFDAWEQAHADDGAQGGETKTVHSLCNACSSKCGFTAYVVDGRLTKLIGDEDHPYAQGKLCARGYGYSQIAYSKDRLTDPLKKNDKGAFEAISWDQAYSEIAEKVKAIIADKGPQALAMVQDPRPSGKYYTKRFMNALGSANVYTHGAACNLSKESGFTQAIGAASYASDMENSKMTMFIGRSYADAIRPSSVVELQRAHENGAHIVLVDPRCNNSIAFADEWVPINPGTDLAFLLAMSNVLV